MAEHHPEEMENETEDEKRLRQAIALSMEDTAPIPAVHETSEVASISNNPTSPTAGGSVELLGVTPISVSMSKSSEGV